MAAIGGRRSASSDTVEGFDPERGRYEVRAATVPETSGIERLIRSAIDDAMPCLKCVALLSLLAAALGGGLAAWLGGEIWAGALMGLVFPPTVALSVGVGLAIAYFYWLVGIGIFHVGYVVLRGVETGNPGRRFDVRPRAWTIDAERGSLELEGRWLRRRVSLRRASLIGVVRAAAAVQDGKAASTYTLWLRVGLRYYRLLGTRAVLEDDALAGISGFAVAVARSLDVPIRYFP